MAELSALNIKITGDAKSLQAAVAAANGDLAKLVAGAEAAGLKVSGLGPKFRGAGDAASGIAPSLKNISMQLSQVGQQSMVTGNFLQALAIQLPDIGIMFGAAGAAAGLLAGITLPILAAAFFSTGEQAAGMADAIKELTAATEAFRVQAAAISLGIDKEEVLVLQQLNSLLAQRAALEEHIAAGIKNAKDTSVMQLATINDMIAPLQAQLDAYRAARGELDAVKAKSEQAQKIFVKMGEEVEKVKTAMVRLVATAPEGGWLSGAIGDAIMLAARLWDAEAAMASMAALSVKATAGTQGQGVVTAPGMIDMGQDRGGKGRANLHMDMTPGGGAAKTNPLIAEMEALQKTLATQEQAQIDSFARQQETLNAALAQRLLTQQEYAALMEASQQQHSDKMAEIDVWRYGTGLQQAGAFLGEMANVFAAGNDKMLKISRIAGAAQGLIDAYGAYLKALNAPGGMTPLQRLAMAGGVLAAGLKAVSAIKGGGGGGGGASGASAATAAAAGPTEMRTANINFYGGFQPTADTISMIANGLNDWLGDGGKLKVGNMA